MGIVVRFDHAHADSVGHKSGRRSLRETPVSRSIGNTNSAGTPRLERVSQYQTWDWVVPMRSARRFWPPTTTQARRRASLDMGPQYPNLGELQPKNMCATAHLSLGTVPAMEPAPKIFARRVRQRRKELGWSEQRLADEMDVTDSTIQYYEGGNLKNPKKVARQAAEALGVDEDWLLGRTDGRPPAPPELTPGQISDIYAGLSATERQEWSRRALAARKNE